MKKLRKPTFTGITKNVIEVLALGAFSVAFHAFLLQSNPGWVVVAVVGIGMFNLMNLRGWEKLWAFATIGAELFLAVILHAGLTSSVIIEYYLFLALWGVGHMVVVFIFLPKLLRG